MKVVGFTMVRNAVKYDYPLVPALQSLLPLCDEVVVCHGNSDDGTLAEIESINSTKIRVIDSVWDDSMREGGRVLAIETDKAYAAIPSDADWCIYIQADEVLHEAGYAAIRQAMQDHQDNKRVEGLLLKYRHFWGSYDYIGDTRSWYRREIRVLRRLPGVHSWKDAQGFRINGRKLHVQLVDAYMHHYGYVRTPDKMRLKANSLAKFWHSDDWIQQNLSQAPEFDYAEIDSLVRYTGTHPAVMQQRIAEKNWRFEPTLAKKMPIKDRILMWIERHTGRRLFEYRNYKLL